MTNDNLVPQLSSFKKYVDDVYNFAVKHFSESSQKNEAPETIEEYWLTYLLPTKKRLTISKDGDKFIGNMDYLWFTKPCNTKEECMKQLEAYIKRNKDIVKDYKITRI